MGVKHYFQKIVINKEYKNKINIKLLQTYRFYSTVYYRFQKLQTNF